MAWVQSQGSKDQERPEEVTEAWTSAWQIKARLGWLLTLAWSWPKLGWSVLRWLCLTIKESQQHARARPINTQAEIRGEAGPRLGVGGKLLRACCPALDLTAGLSGFLLFFKFFKEAYRRFLQRKASGKDLQVSCLLCCLGGGKKRCSPQPLNWPLWPHLVYIFRKTQMLKSREKQRSPGRIWLLTVLDQLMIAQGVKLPLRRCKERRLDMVLFLWWPCDRVI